VLCPSCRRQIARSAVLCASCGTLLRPQETPIELVLHDGTRVPLIETVTIGRAPGNTIQLAEPSVSRHHAQVLVEDGVPELEDVGSSYGTWLDDRELNGRAPLRDGSRIQLGDVEVRVEAWRDDAESGRTVIVPAGATLVVPQAGRSEVEPVAIDAAARPRVRSGWALKRLEAEEGDRRFVLSDLRHGTFVRMTADDAALFELLDGQRSLHELIAEAQTRFGPSGAARLASLLTDLGRRGLLEGVEGAETSEQRSLLARVFRPHTFVVPGLGRLFERLYRHGGFLLFTPVAVAMGVLLAVCGGGVFVYLIAGRYGTPFVVASRLGLGGLVFLVGRFLVVLLHEFAHGLTVVSFGRRVPRAGVKVVLVFPYAFVDTSEAWFEPRRRRLAISAAGPASDLVVGGVAAIAAASTTATLRDVFFQLALAAYIGAFFNLNPLLERDGYHMLVDLLQEPGLRRKSQQWLLGRLEHRRASVGDTSVLAAYAAAAFAWSILMALFTIVISRRYYAALVAVAPRAVVWLILGLLYLLVLLPIVLVVYRALAARARETRGHADVTA
jgi:putative peptide zinc metalloprotease protein